MEKYSYEVLKPIVGESVEVRDEAGKTLSLKIEDVRRGRLNNDEWDSVSVLYQGDDSFFIPDGIYTFAHPAFGEVSLYISPKSSVEYETIVTRRLKSSCSA